MTKLQLTQKEQYEKDYWESCEFSTYINKLHKESTWLYKDVLEASDKHIPMAEHRLSKIYSLFQTAHIYMVIKGMEHYEFTSLFSDWENFYGEIYDTIKDNDSNTSWLHSRYNTYKQQYDLVNEMIVPHIAYLREKIGLPPVNKSKD